MSTWRTWCPHSVVTTLGVRIIQIAGGRRWSLAVYVKPKEVRDVDQ